MQKRLINTCISLCCILSSAIKNESFQYEIVQISSGKNVFQCAGQRFSKNKLSNNAFFFILLCITIAYLYEMKRKDIFLFFFTSFFKRHFKEVAVLIVPDLKIKYFSRSPFHKYSFLEAKAS